MGCLEERPLKTEASALLSAGANSRAFVLLPLWARIVVPTLLAISLSLNIVSVLGSTPFLSLDISPSQVGDLVKIPNGQYGLVHTIDLLIQNKIWALAILLILFSGAFPFVKLLWTTCVLLVPMPRDRQRRSKWRHPHLLLFSSGT